MVIFWLIWFFCGILGCLIYNKTITYEASWLKYVWNFIVCGCGIVGLLVACLTWLSLKIK